jgi:hypothetical protein
MSSGFQWGSWAFMQKSAADFDDESIADAGSALSDSYDLDGKAACEVRVAATEDNTGACDGDVVAYIVRGSQDAGDQLSLGAVITMTQNTTREGVFAVDPGRVGDFKVLVENDCGQTVTVDVQVRTATFGTGS